MVRLGEGPEGPASRLEEVDQGETPEQGDDGVYELVTVALEVTHVIGSPHGERKQVFKHELSEPGDLEGGVENQVRSMIEAAAVQTNIAYDAYERRLFRG